MEATASNKKNAMNLNETMTNIILQYEGLDKEVLSLRGQLAALTEENLNLKKSILVVPKLEGKLKESTFIETSLKTEVVQLKNISQSREKEIENITKENSQIKVQKSQIISQYENRLKESSATESILKNELNNSKALVESNKKENQKMNQEFEKVKKANATLSSEIEKNRLNSEKNHRMQTNEMLLLAENSLKMEVELSKTKSKLDILEKKHQYTLVELNKESLAHKNTTETAQSKIKTFNEDFDDLKSQMMILKKNHQQLNLNHSNLISENEQLKGKLEIQNKFFIDQNEIIFKLSREADLNSQELSKNLFAIQNERSALKFKEECLDSERINLSEKASQLDLVSGELSQAHEIIEDLRTQLATTDFRLQEQSQNYELKIASLFTDLSAQNESILEENLKLKNDMNLQSQTYQDAIFMAQSRFEVEFTSKVNEQKIQWTQQQNIREKQIEQFVAFNNQEKSKYQKVINQLAQEIHQAITLHPLKDYLVATEKELSRVECDLKKTPTSSPHRKDLEVAVDQLIHQRDDIRSLITKTEGVFVNHLGSLERIARSGVLQQTPPLPPPG
jgi:hypothetical protein